MSIQQQLHDSQKTMLDSLRFPELLFVEDQLHEILNKADGLIQKTCVTLLKSGGKRVRPLLTLYSGMCFGPLNSLMIKASVSAEMIHMASLIHDDIIDKSETRRGKPTMNSIYGEHAAILTGDYLFAEAFNILSTEQLLKTMRFFIEAIQAMCAGEVNQAAAQFSDTIEKEQYFKRIAQKTGILLAACCQSGALLADAGVEEIEAFREFGLNIGYAYQITDDILDLSGSTESLGKPVGSDLLNGNITLPLIYLMDNPVYGNWLREILISHKMNCQGLHSIYEALISSRSLEKAQLTATRCIDKAKACLGKIPASPYRTALINLSDSILLRTS
ncbi:polyprenyl synthetase family protein [Desulfosporosinus sp. FKA]|uniref:polyprenyl synthetase family protein n=1 Tax=Desulfosporosinus sp. FKA TaxID=1969834 RepID=UPI000B4A07D0|nr:polyprenyl synthetase family protein [Desulfosporosinus sp. FKA]